MFRINWKANILLAKRIYRFSERIFEIVTSIATSILGNSITIESHDHSPRQQRIDRRNENRHQRERDRQHN